MRIVRRRLTSHPIVWSAILAAGGSAGALEPASTTLTPREGVAPYTPNAAYQGGTRSGIAGPRAGYDPTSAYGLGKAQQNVDRDHISRFVKRATAGMGKDETIEESEAEEILNAFEDEHKVYIPERDLLLTSQLTSTGLINAMNNALLQGGSNASDVDLRRERWVPIGPAVRHGRYEERQRLPGLTDGAGNQFYGNATQKSIGLTRDYRSEVTRHYGSGAAASLPQPYATSYAEAAARRDRNPYFPPEPTIRDLDERATEFYSNGQPRFNNEGLEVYPNGRRKVSDAGVPLYSNGRPRVDGSGRPLHSNGRRKQTDDGRALYANGLPKTRRDGTVLLRNGRPAATTDGRRLHPNGMAAETPAGVQLLPNGQRQFTGDGTGLVRGVADPTEPLRADEGLALSPFIRRDQTRPADFIQELYANGRPAYGTDGTRLYSNGRPRVNEQGQYLNAEGQPIADRLGRALGPNGEVLRGQFGPRARLQGYFPIYDVIDARVVRRDRRGLTLRPTKRSDGDEITLSATEMQDLDVIATGEATPRRQRLDDLPQQAAVRLLRRTLSQYVDDQLVDQRATEPLALLVATGKPKTNDPAPASPANPPDESGLLWTAVSGSVKTVTPTKLTLDIDGMGTRTFTLDSSTAFQRRVKSRGTDAAWKPIPVDGLRVGSRVQVITAVPTAATPRVTAVLME